MADNWTPVTDPALLQQLEGGGGWTPVDPTTSKFLDQVPAGGQAPVKTGMPSLMTDFLYGMRQPIDQGKAMLARALFPSQVPNVAAGTKAAEEAYRQEGADFGAASTGARLAGNVATTAPIAFAMPGAGAAGLGARMLSGAASATATGSLQPVDVTAPDFWQQTRNNALLSAPAGAAAPAVLSGLARLVNPKATARVAPLMEKGITPTPGQVVGGAPGRIEEALSSWPIAGDFIRAGQSRALRQFDRAAIDDVLAPIGQKLETSEAGRPALIEMSDKVDDAWRKATPQSAGQLNKVTLDKLDNLLKMSKFTPRAQEFESIMKSQIGANLSPTGYLSGDAFKNIDSALGKIVRDTVYGHGVPWADRQLGGAVRELQSTLRDWLAHVNPQAAEALGNARNASARMLRVEHAANMRGGDPGEFSAAQLLAGVEKYTKSKTQLMKGQAPGQAFADAAKKVLGSKVPDSGTPFRSAVGLAGSALLGGPLGGQIGSGVGQTAAALGGAGLGAGLMYSPWGQAAMAHLLGGDRFGLGVPAAQAIRNLAPAGAAIAPWAGAAIAPWALGGAPAH